jgi:mycofactocin system glycosyltransferase
VTGGATAHRLSRRTRRLAGGRVLVGGWPPRRIRLSAAGAAALDAALRGEAEPGAAGLLRRLVGYGMVEPVAGPAGAPVTFVVPARDGGPELAGLVSELKGFGAVLVVDDGSADGTPERARRAGAGVIANDGEPGPAGARNTGWRSVETEFVAFVDADCRVDGDWARPLAALLAADPGLALAAPRIRGAREPGWLARWERIGSPLDMGLEGGLAGPGRPVSYVPSAALVARRAALDALGGFDASLRFGEDVDLVWRAVAAGWGVRYAPEIEVMHPSRPTLRARARQHFEYGTSAAVLERRHPGSAVPLRPSRTMIPAGLLMARSAGGALLAAVVLAATAAGRQPDREVRLAVARLVVEAELGAGRLLARALSREWLPLTLLALLRPGRLRGFALAAVAIDVATATAPDPVRAPANALLRLADNAAYCAGLWRGALAQRSARVLLPGS